MTREEVTLLRAGFAKTFAPHLAESHRWSAFTFIADILIARSFSQPTLIVETGCARQENNWNGDGQSTIVWSWLAGQLDGFAYSVDINPDNVNTARALAPNARITVGDSVDFLRHFGNASSISLLYLDSFDYKTGSLDAAEHHLRELQAIYDRLPADCIIAVDDCITPTEGKGALVRQWLEERGNLPVLEGYVTVWLK
jgi:SAM-dependent methyltransferase